MTAGVRKVWPIQPSISALLLAKLEHTTRDLKVVALSFNYSTLFVSLKMHADTFSIWMGWFPPKTGSGEIQSQCYLGLVDPCFLYSSIAGVLLGSSIFLA